MNRLVAIDSNVLVALLDQRDQWNQQARALIVGLKAENAALVFFDSVLNETISVMARRAIEQKRPTEFPLLLSELLRQVPEEAITWISLETQRLFRQIVELVSETGGLLNFHDALIVLSCQELGIEAVASFDEDFDDIEGLLRISSPSV